MNASSAYLTRLRDQIVAALIAAGPVEAPTREVTP